MDTCAGKPYKAPAPLGFKAWRDAQVAQLVEHATENRSVGGSTPSLGTISLSQMVSEALIFPLNY